MEIKSPKDVKIKWYRSPVDPGELRALNRRSNFRGLVQSLGYLGLLTMTGAGAIFSVGRLSWPYVVLIVFIHGTFSSFLVNGFHELVHGTVFRTKRLNSIFLYVLSFFGWFLPDFFWASHTTHHIQTLHAPPDYEVVLPMKFTLKSYLKLAFINWKGFYYTLRAIVRMARGKLRGRFEHHLFGSRPDLQKRLFTWSRVLVMGHGTILFASLLQGWWMVPVVVSLPNFYGGWLFYLHNNVQHAGLMDKVNDFRLCARTIVVNPFFEFIYWHMNYHIEHHMYAAVPCYNLKKLHRLIEKDLPHCPQSLLETWLQINSIQQKQKIDPSYQFRAELPVRNG